MREAGAELVRRATLAQETAIDQLDVNAAVLDHLDGVRDLHELTAAPIRCAPYAYCGRS
jgi:hypothetical protein